MVLSKDATQLDLYLRKDKLTAMHPREGGWYDEETMSMMPEFMRDGRKKPYTKDIMRHS